MRKSCLTCCDDGSVSLVLLDGMHAENIKAVEELSYDSITLSYGDWDDISLLSGFLEKIRKIKLIGSDNVDLASLCRLTNIENLMLWNISICKGRDFLDFSELKRLAYYESNWKASKATVATLFECTSLETVKLTGYHGNNLEGFGSLRKLNNLELISPKIESLEGIEGAMDLSRLYVSLSTKLADISDVSSLIKLESIAFHKCKALKSLNGLQKLPSLRRLTLSDVADVVGIEMLREVEGLSWFSTNMVLDTNAISILLCLRKIDVLVFVGQSNYFNDRQLKDLLDGVDREVEVVVLKAGGKTSYYFYFDDPSGRGIESGAAKIKAMLQNNIYNYMFLWKGDSM